MLLDSSYPIEYFFFMVYQFKENFVCGILDKYANSHTADVKLQWSCHGLFHAIFQLLRITLSRSP